MKSSWSGNLFCGLCCAIAGGFIACAGNSHSESSSSDEVVDVLNVKRINIVEDDGSYALVLANSQNLPGVVRNGKEGSRTLREGVGGIIYYNSKGDEVGGLITNLKEGENASDGGIQISMDQLNDQGQAISLMHWLSGDFVRSALRIYDLPTDKPHSTMNTNPRVREIVKRLRNASSNAEAKAIDREYKTALGEEGLWAERIFLGSEGGQSRKAMLELRDSKSQTRIRLIVDEDDQPRIEFLDAEGQVTRSWDGTAGER